MAPAFVGLRRATTAVLLSVTLAAAACGGGDDGSEDSRATSTSTTEPATTTTTAATVDASVAATIPLPASVHRFTVAHGAVWLGGYYEEVVRIDLSTLQATGTGIQGLPVAIGSRLWVFGESVYEMDAAGQATPLGETSAAPEDLVVLGRSVMATGGDFIVFHEPEVGAFNGELDVEADFDLMAALGPVVFGSVEDGGGIMRLDPAQPLDRPVVDVGGQPSALLGYAGVIWAAVPDANHVARIDPATLAVTTIEAGTSPSALLGYAGGVWVANTGAASVTRIDTATSLTEDVATGLAPRGMAVAGNALWVTNSNDNTVSRIDLVSLSETGTLQVEEEPILAYSLGSRVFVYNSSSSTLSVIDSGDPLEAPTLTVTIDGAAATLEGPAGDDGEAVAVAGIVQDVLGQAPADETKRGALRTTKSVVVRSSADFVTDASSQIATVAQRLEATGFVVDRAYTGVAEPGLTLLENLLDALFADASVLFATGSAELTDAAYPLLSRAAELICDIPFVTFEIAGHTDDVGDDASNQALSEARANAVREYLVNYCVPPEQLVAVGYGESQPKAPNDTEEGRALNRRIEFRLIR